MSGLRPFRFGVICEQMQSAEEWVTKARQAEDYGYATFLIRDHFIKEPFGDQLAPMIALMAAASVTKTLRVGSLVLDNDYRHPVMLAKEAAQYGFSYFVVSDANMEAFVPIVARLAGDKRR
jgi:alkanesulfonate monooxygenase SsuD/methylene tetrahydromethanopterin reductase-like flavin-dependent oxidoreductase (luciferase family)